MDNIPTRTTNLIRHLNEIRCLRLVRRSAPMSRAEVARSLGLTRATSGNVVADLLDRGLLVELPDALESGKAGRPGRSIALNPDGAYFVGLDISSRWVAGVLVDFSGRALSQLTIPNARGALEPTTVAVTAADLARRLVIGASVPPAMVRGVGISVPGIVDGSGVVASARLLGWESVDFASLVSATLGAPWPVQICNDAVALATAIGALDTEEAPDILVLLLSEGIGSALIREGKVSEGASGFAGEVGHMILTTDLENSAAHTFGVLGGYNVFRRHLREGVSVQEGLERLAALPERGSDLRDDLDAWALVMTVGLINLIHILNPARIVLGGPLSTLFPLVREQVEPAVRLRLLNGLAMPPIEVAGFGEFSVAAGAAGTVRETIFLLSDEFAASISLKQ